MIKNSTLNEESKELTFSTSKQLEKPKTHIFERVVDESTWNTLSDLTNIAISSVLVHDEPENVSEINDDSLNYEEMVIIDNGQDSKLKLALLTITRN